MKNPAKNIKWNLDSLYKGIADPQMETDLEEIQNLTNTFIGKYKGNISKGELSIEAFREAIVKYEDILNLLYTYESYAGLLHAKDTISDPISRLHSKAEEFGAEITSKLVFFDLEILQIPEDILTQYLTSDLLANYLEYLKRIHTFKKFTLSEDQEIILRKKSQTSYSAFVRLYDQLSASTIYSLRIKKKVRRYNYSEITNILSSHSDRNMREAAANSMTEVYKKDSRTYAFILNTLLLDKKISDEVRHYDYPQQATLISDEVDLETVNTMTAVIEKNYTIPEGFYTVKSKIVGDMLYEWDRYSSIYPEIEEPTYSYKLAKEIILEAFGKFSPTFKAIAEKFFKNGWIDAELSEGKKSGAFCSYTVPGKHPVILTNYTGKANDVRTLAHELGHAIHGYLSREQTLLNFWPVTPFAEIASIFAENLVFRAIYSDINDKKQKANLLGGRIQEIFATIFRQNAFYLFESDIHAIRRIDGELSTQEFNDLFQKRTQATFGKGLTLTEGHRYWWIPIAHFFHYNFYVFSYSFGQTLSNALYSKYLNDGSSFAEHYIEVLKMGSSKNLKDLTVKLGVDIQSPDFWQEGIEPIKYLVEDFNKLVTT